MEPQQELSTFDREGWYAVEFECMKCGKRIIWSYPENTRVQCPFCLYNKVWVLREVPSSNDYFPDIEQENSDDGDYSES